jgi:hypothetical protein
MIFFRSAVSHVLLVALVFLTMKIAADAASFYPTGGDAYQLVVADLNHDGKPDVITAGPATLSVLLNRGDGTLLPHLDYPSDNGYFLAIADFNNDGNLDAVTVSQRAEDPVDIFLGNGDGTFQGARTLQTIAALTLGGWQRVTSMGMATRI